MSQGRTEAAYDRLEMVTWELARLLENRSSFIAMYGEAKWHNAISDATQRMKALLDHQGWVLP